MGRGNKTTFSISIYRSIIESKIFIFLQSLETNDQIRKPFNIYQDPNYQTEICGGIFHLLICCTRLHIVPIILSLGLVARNITDFFSFVGEAELEKVVRCFWFRFGLLKLCKYKRNSFQPFDQRRNKLIMEQFCYKLKRKHHVIRKVEGHVGYIIWFLAKVHGQYDVSFSSKFVKSYINQSCLNWVFL